MGCNSVLEVLELFVAHELDDDKAEQIEMHVASCVTCANERRQLESVQQALRRAFVVASPRRNGRRPRVRRLLMLGGTACALLIVGWVSISVFHFNEPIHQSFDEPNGKALESLHYVPWFKLIQDAKVIVVGEVVDIGWWPWGIIGEQVATFRVDAVLKGSLREGHLTLPFRRRRFICPDDGIEYPKSRYLLLIDDASRYRVMGYPNNTRVVIPSLDCFEVRFVRNVVAIQQGRDVQQNLRDLSELVKERKVSEEWGSRRWRHVMEFLQTRSRAEVAPVIEGEFHHLLDLARDTRDFRLVASLMNLLQLPQLNERAKGEFLETMGLITEQSFHSREEFERWWSTAVQRANAQPPFIPIESVPAIVDRLVFDLLLPRDEASQQITKNKILDLGPDAIEPVQKLLPTVKGTARPDLERILRELEVLRKIRDDLDPSRK